MPPGAIWQCVRLGLCLGRIRSCRDPAPPCRIPAAGARCPPGKWEIQGFPPRLGAGRRARSTGSVSWSSAGRRAARRSAAWHRAPSRWIETFTLRSSPRLSRGRRSGVRNPVGFEPSSIQFLVQYLAQYDIDVARGKDEAEVGEGGEGGDDEGTEKREEEGNEGEKQGKGDGKEGHCDKRYQG